MSLSVSIASLKSIIPRDEPLFDDNTKATLRHPFYLSAQVSSLPGRVCAWISIQKDLGKLSSIERDTLQQQLNKIHRILRFAHAAIGYQFYSSSKNFLPIDRKKALQEFANAEDFLEEDTNLYPFELRLQEKREAPPFIQQKVALQQAIHQAAGEISKFQEQLDRQNAKLSQHTQCVIF